jgi:hypothetical protein
MALPGLVAYSVPTRSTDRLTLAGVTLRISAVAAIATLPHALDLGRVDPMVVPRE